MNKMIVIILGFITGLVIVASGDIAQGLILTCLGFVGGLITGLDS